MWMHDYSDISEALSGCAYCRRFLGAWNYMHLMSLLCVTGLSMKLCTPWIEAVVQPFGRGRGCLVTIRHHLDICIWWQLRSACIIRQPILSNLMRLLVPPLSHVPHAYRPYWQESGPPIPIYSCHKSQDVIETMLAMPVPPKKERAIRATVRIAYEHPWQMGNWLPQGFYPDFPYSAIF